MQRHQVVGDQTKRLATPVNANAHLRLQIQKRKTSITDGKANNIQCRRASTMEEKSMCTGRKVPPLTRSASLEGHETMPQAALTAKNKQHRRAVAINNRRVKLRGRGDGHECSLECAENMTRVRRVMGMTHAK